MPFLEAYFRLERESHYVILRIELRALHKAPVNQRKKFWRILETVIPASHALESGHNLTVSFSSLVSNVVEVLQNLGRQPAYSHIDSKIDLGISGVVVKVDHIRLVLPDGIVHTPHKLVRERGVKGIASVVMFRAIKILRIKAFPPLAFAVLLGLHSIVWYSCIWAVPVTAVADCHKLAVRPCGSGVETDSKRHIVFCRDFLPYPHDILMRPHVHGIPGLIGRIPAVEIVVMVAHCHKIPCAHSDIKLHQVLRIPQIYVPVVANILITIFGWMAVMLQVVPVLFAPFLVHPAGIPVPVFRCGLGIPMGPGAKFGFPPPLRNIIVSAQIVPFLSIPACLRFKRGQIPDVSGGSRRHQ